MKDGILSESGVKARISLCPERGQEAYGQKEYDNERASADGEAL